METKDERLLELKLSLTLSQHYMFFIFLHTLVDCGYFYTVQQHHRWLRELTSNMKLSKDLIVLDYLFWSGDEFGLLSIIFHVCFYRRKRSYTDAGKITVLPFE